MRNVLCWTPSEVRQVINPFAEHISDGVFRAVHSDWELRVTGPVGKSFQEIGDAAWSNLSPAEFLADFLREDRPHALAVILGETGSGKSHLVHWMRLHLRDDDQRMLLVVRKSGTSLRAIVRDLIGRLPVDQQQSFLDTFNAAGDGLMSRDARKHELLNHLAQAIREDQPRREADELEAELLDSLPHLIQDPYMRQAHFLGDGGVIGEIVDHIFAESNAKDRPERRRDFAVNDLALGGLDFVHATKLAKDALELIDLDPATNTSLAIEIINRNLDRAVARTLSFSGDRIEELMMRLRAHLKAQGKELVLLVEEFARLQGIDRALLQAITAQGDDRQCRMRTAIAVTTGFFASVAETAYMRTTHIVDMDQSAGRSEGQGVTPRALSEFAARYLNAARLGRERIGNWSEGAAPGEAAPSVCPNCPHVSTCHATFGEVDGYGLYPFTERALTNLASRVDRSMPASFNPRILQNDLLVEVLDNFAPDIEAGAYPSPRLLEKVGGAKLPVSVESALQAKDAQAAPRWIAALEIYDGTGRIVELPRRFREVFSIPPIPDALAPTTPSTPSAPVITPGQGQPRTVNPDDEAIESWIRGGLLNERVAVRLRDLLFPAIADAIDWDMLGMARADFAGGAGAFKRTSISFVRQSTRASSRAGVQMEIAADAKTGTALQGLLRAAQDQFRWHFEGGDRALAAFLDCLDGWSAEVVRQLRHLVAPTPRWNQAAGALQLLCVAAAIGGKIKADATAADIIDAVFDGLPSDPAASTRDLRNLFAKLSREREHLVGVVRAQASSLKGGRAGAMLDPLRALSPVRALRASKWHLDLDPGDNVDKVATLYREVAMNLSAAVVAERDVRLTWLADMEAAFGSSTPRAAIIAALDDARQQTFDAGISTENTRRALVEALDRFKTTQYDDAIAAARQLARLEDPVAALPQFGRGRANAVEAGTALRQVATQFLDAVERNLEQDGVGQSAGAADVARSLESLEKDLGAIVEDLTALTMQGEPSRVA
ncbi:protein DpdH [Rubellimicrobium roseum]|uniref:ATP-binding protein n=1 Tax=Rubellimicrobium roseum TaxID=687525 RepID=A0A5C4NP04_9RHOB|nr:protein DpdH [Rubellimicrobium roseum]TNC74347.1 ATP-binding protein [Rubellimicrobium roseum]